MPGETGFAFIERRQFSSSQRGGKHLIAARKEGGMAMHIMTFATYPLKSVNAVAKKFIEVMQEPLPDYMRMTAFYVEYGGKGINAYTPVEIDKGHEEDGIRELTKWYTNFFDIEGYEVVSRVVYTAEEALPLIGMSL